MKVLLVNAGEDIIALSCEPIGLEYLASYLEQFEIEVKICNMIQHNPKKIIKDWNPDFVGVSATTPVVLSAYRLLDYCWTIGMPTIIGGVHASTMPEEAIKHANWVVVGDGEEALLNIINGKVKPGIVRSEYIKDISKLPPPARHLIDIDYFYTASGHGWPFGEHKKTATIMTARGCPFKCSFCRNSKAFCPPRYNSVENVLKEISDIKETYNVDKFYFLDDDLLLPRPRFKKIADGLMPLKIRWGMAARASSLSKENVLLAKAAGCEYIFIGFESNSQKCLDALDKRTTVEDNQRAVDICNEYGIKVVAGFMVGIPTETPEEIEKTIDFIKRNKFFSIGLCMATPMPGTKLWDYAKENNLLPELSWDDFTIGNPKLNMVPNPLMSYEETKKYFDTIDNLCEKKRTSIQISWMWDTFKKYPVAAIKTIWRYRKRLIRYLGRIK